MKLELAELPMILKGTSNWLMLAQFDMNGCCAAGRGLTRGTRYNVCTDAAFTNSALTARLRVRSEFSAAAQFNASFPFYCHY